jgi:SAM-dependent methyltransferase
MLAAAQRRNAEAIGAGRVQLSRGDGTTLPVETDTVDGALAVHTLYFWPKPETTLTEVARVLRPGGRLVLAFRDGAYPAPRRFDLTVYRLYPAGDVAAMLERAGFIEVEIHAPDHPHLVVWIRAKIGER